MTATVPVIKVQPDSNAAEVLQQAAKTGAVVEANGIRYRVAAEDPTVFYDAERVREAFHRAFGMLEGVDAEALKAEIRAQRGHDDEP